MSEKDFETYKKELFLQVLMEECAEVVQAVSKINRFGLKSTSPYAKTTNRENLVAELGDVLGMIELVKALPYLNITDEELQEAKEKKIVKMTYWLHNPVNKLD